jgi:hypothetical protein
LIIVSFFLSEEGQASGENYLQGENLFIAAVFLVGQVRAYGFIEAAHGAE